MRVFLFFSELSIIFLQIAQDSVQLKTNREITDKHMTQWKDKGVLIIQKEEIIYPASERKKENKKTHTDFLKKLNNPRGQCKFKIKD